MSRAVLVQLILNLLVLGSLYTLVAVGLSLIFSVMRIVNFAHAQMYVLGAFAFYYLYSDWKLPYALAIVLSVAVVAVFGLVVEVVVIRPVAGDQLRGMIVTLGLLLVMSGLELEAFGSQSKFITLPFAGVVTLVGGIVPVQSIVACAITFVVVAALLGVLRWTRIGQAMRALAQDREGARLQGINTARMNAVGFALGCGLAALAGALILPITASIDPSSGDPILAKMFIIVILGGLGSIGGAILGAFVLAAIETIGFQYVGSFNILLTYLLVIAILLARPQGLLVRE